MTNTSITEYRQESDDPDRYYGFMIDRLNLVGSSEGTTFNTRFDLFGFKDPPGAEFQNDAVWERLTVQRGSGDWNLLGGDFYQQLGRGLVLSIRKQDEIGVDMALRGGQLRYSSETQGVTLFGGLTNLANIDGISQYHVDDPHDLISGGTYEFTGLDFLRVGVIGMYLQPRERLLEERDYTTTAGFFTEIPSISDVMSVYLEVDAQERVLAGNREKGYAGYLTADFVFDDTAAVVEGIYLDQFEQKGSRNSALGTRLDYNQAPTLERIDQEVFNTRDVLGGRLRLEHYFYDLSLLIYANGMYRINDRSDTDLAVSGYHGYSGLEYEFNEGGSHVKASGGYRVDTQNDIEVKSIVHGETDYLQHLTGPFSLHLAATHESRTLAGNDYERGSTFLGAEISSLGSATFEFGYDTQDKSAGARQLFYAGQFSVDVTDHIKTTATVGTQRGGIKCINGVCRDYPEFGGVRAEIVGRY
jgi:hypothetical protein